MYRVEVRECLLAADHWLWEWRVLSRWGLVAHEGGGCGSEEEARRDGEEAAARLAEARQRGSWRK